MTSGCESSGCGMTSMDRPKTDLSRSDRRTSAGGPDLDDGCSAHQEDAVGIGGRPEVLEFAQHSHDSAARRRPPDEAGPRPVRPGAPGTPGLMSARPAAGNGQDRQRLARRRSPGRPRVPGAHAVVRRSTLLRRTRLAKCEQSTSSNSWAMTARSMSAGSPTVEGARARSVRPPRR